MITMMLNMRTYIIMASFIVVINYTGTMEPGVTLPTTLSPTGFALIGDILLGTIPLKTLWKQPDAFPFADLSLDVRDEAIGFIIVGTTSETLAIAISAINGLVRLHKKFDNLIHCPHYFVQLVKQLAKRFNKTEEEVYYALQT